MFLIEESTTAEEESRYPPEPEHSIRVQQVRCQLHDGIYPLENYLELALDRVLEDLLN